jgi:ABC-type branched-subunit amino acid transport system permease subunit
VVTGGPFGLRDFGSFPRLLSEDVQPHEGIHLIVLGFAAAGITTLLFFCEQTNAGNTFRAIREDPLPAQNHGRRCRN